MEKPRQEEGRRSHYAGRRRVRRVNTISRRYNLSQSECVGRRLRFPKPDELSDEPEHTRLLSFQRCSSGGGFRFSKFDAVGLCAQLSWPFGSRTKEVYRAHTFRLVSSPLPLTSQLDSDTNNGTIFI
jgi:hypothetical protein